MEQLEIIFNDIRNEFENNLKENGKPFIGQDKIDRLKELGNE